MLCAISALKPAFCGAKATPIVTQLRFRRIRGRNPSEPHFDRKAMIEACKPIIPPAVYTCQQSLVKEQEVELHPYYVLCAKKLREEMQQSKMVLFFHENSIKRESKRIISNMLTKQGMHLKGYSSLTFSEAIKGTPFENAYPFSHSRGSVVLCEHDDLARVFKLSRKMPQYILLAGILEGKFFSRNELQRLSTLPKKEILLATTCHLLNSVALTTSNTLSAQQRRLVSLLDQHKSSTE